MNACILKHLSMILTRNVIDYFFIIQGSSQNGTIEYEEVSETFFVDD